MSAESLSLPPLSGHRELEAQLQEEFVSKMMRGPLYHAVSAWMRSLTPPAPGAAITATPGMGGACARRQRTDLFGDDGARCAGR